MRNKIAAANWKMNLTLTEGEKLLDEILKENIELIEHQQAIFAVPFPYLQFAQKKVLGRKNYFISAQDCSDKKSGAYTGEVSVDMIASLQITHVIIGHSERRAYFNESNSMLADKINLILEKGLIPIFCCGESLEIRESGKQNEFVAKQMSESLFHLQPGQIEKIIIAYEPIWAIGTGKTATTLEAQDMHGHLRTTLARQYGDKIADEISILYGGSVKGNNAMELFSQPDVDGGLVGGASLNAQEFCTIIKSLPK
ncbi:MAG: triose-phosphate isomerase [Bacteroidetes bacterium]|nr:triose-phosphate isomerase [Bacteroidota bacterium]